MLVAYKMYVGRCYFGSIIRKILFNTVCHFDKWSYITKFILIIKKYKVCIKLVTNQVKS